MNIYLSAFLVLELFGKIFSNDIGVTENAIISENNINDKLNYMDVLMEDLLNHHWEKEESPCLNKILDIMNNVKNSTLWAVWGKIFSNDIGVTENAIIAENNINDKLNYMDVLMEDLLNHHWEKEESPCLNKILDIMNNVKNFTLWAVWVWDSMQTPAGLLYGSQYNLGNYDQCMNSPWLETHSEFRTQYCLADIKLSETIPNNKIGDPYRSVKYHMNSMTKYGLKFNRITWGVCIPAECKTKSTIKFVRSMLKYTHLGPEIYNINVHHCQVAGTIKESSWGIYLIMIFLSIIIVVTVICTIINKAKPTSHDTLGNKLLKAFCLTTNTFFLNKVSKDDIKVLHGLRVLSSYMVVSMHVLFLSHIIGFSNSLTLEKDLDRLNLKAALRADYAVDVFFLMSGLLRIKSFMAIGNINPLKAVLKRYLRYIILVGIFIICIINIDNYVGDGPLWFPKIDEESKACEKNWLISLLMLGNYIDIDNMCYPILWTVACDFHLSVVATILYWIFKKNQKKGFIAYLILTMAALITPGIVSGHQNLPKFDFVLADQHKKVFLNGSYMMSHLRGGPYFLGIALGYIMSKYKPDRYRNSISKFTSLLGMLFAAITAVSIIILGVSLQNKTDSGVLMSFVFSSLHRSIWALAIGCIIIVCEYGTVPLIRTVLTWSFFVPFSKISYCVYLVHIIINALMVATTRSTLHHNALLMVIYSLAVMSVSCIASMLLYLFVEAPFNRIIDIMIDIKADNIQKNKSATVSKIKTGVLKSNETKKNT